MLLRYVMTVALVVSGVAGKLNDLDCRRACYSDIIQKPPNGLHCSGGHRECLCSKPSFFHAVRDCSLAACRSQTLSSTLYKEVEQYCSTVGAFPPLSTTVQEILIAWLADNLENVEFSDKGYNKPSITASSCYWRNLTENQSLVSSTIANNIVPNAPSTAREWLSPTSLVGQHGIKTPTPSPIRGVSSSDASYWLEHVQHQGTAAFNSNSSNYKVFRNVRDYGAKGDGVTDDTAAINLAISDGGRFGPAGRRSSTTTPAVVYFPAGTYVISAPIIDYYFTQLVGNPNLLPVIKASSSFSGKWLIDGDQYQSDGAQGWKSTNVFFRQIRNLVLDMTAVPATVEITGIHWPTGQATSIQNVQILMSSEYGTEHQGLFIENGSGGFINDILITGGKYGANLGNQQFTIRNLTVVDAGIGIRQIWNWGWTYQGINLVNCTTAFSMTNSGVGNQEVGSVNIIDSTVRDCQVFVDTVWTESNRSNGSLILENISLSNVPIAVNGTNGTILPGSADSMTITAWGQGHRYTPAGPSSFQGGFVAPTRAKGLLARGSSHYYTKSKPQYEKAPVSSFISVRSAGAKGDGITDDTSAIQAALHSAARSGRILFFDQGVFKVSNTIYIPPGSRIVGESFPVIMGGGAKFSDKRHPVPVVEVGHAGECGLIEWSDMIVSTQGATSGAVLIKWNLKATSGSGMWDVHVRVGGFAGSELQVAQCPTSAGNSSRCEAGFLMMHITKSARNVYMENCWIWTADHDLDDPSDTQISVYTGRGLLVEGENIWLYGTSVEHHSLYQYQFSDAHNVVAGYIQTETPYWQPTNDTSLGPYPTDTTIQDPTFSNCLSGPCSALGLRVRGGHSLAIYGAGLYSFFHQYSTSCSEPSNTDKCQGEIFSIEDVGGDMIIYSLNTVGTTDMIVRDGHRLARYSDNLATFASTIAYFAS